MSQIKAIETQYNGYRFRSRLEARYAVLFDGFGITYEYEKEGFELESGRYLPDFWLPQLKVWFEVKGLPLEEKDAHRHIELCRKTQRDLIVAVGDLAHESGHAHYHYKWIHPEESAVMLKDPGAFGIAEKVIAAVKSGFAVMYHFDVPVFKLLTLLDLDPREQASYIACMRSARFEHGESGSIY